MIVLDTHIWVWWVHGDKQLSKSQLEVIQSNENDIIGICAISCWEVAKLVEKGRLELPCPVMEWFEEALTYPGIRILELTPAIAVMSTELPGKFHSDPADQLIVATAIKNNCPLVTSDEKIIAYPHIITIA